MANSSALSPPLTTGATTVTEQHGPQVKVARRIACELCRAAKVKCFKGNESEENQCRRCNDAGIECSFAPVVTRRRRKRTDARVTILEEELRKIKSTLQPSGDYNASPKSHKRKSKADNCLPLFPKTSSHHGQHSSTQSSLIPNDDPLSVISGLMSKDEAVKLLVDFMQDLLPQHPIIAFAESDSYDSLEMEKPLLLLAVITAASGAENQALFQELHSRLVEILTLRVFVRGEASLELIQSIMVMEVWYSAPEDIRKARFYQWIHAAATMALQLGLGDETFGEPSKHPLNTAMTGPTEESRTLLSCFLLCSCVAVSMRKESILGLSTGVRYALNDLSESATSVDHRRLLALIRLQLIAEQGLMLLSTQSQASLNAYEQESTLSEEILYLNNQYEEWRRTLEGDVMTDAMMIHFLYCKARLFEIPLHLRHGFDALVPPFVSKSSWNKECFQPRAHSTNSGDTSENQHFLRACHALLQTFLAISPEILAKCPNVTFVRAIYASKALLMMKELFVPTKDSQSGRGHQLQVRSVLRRVHDHIAAVFQPQTWVTPPLSLRLLNQIAGSHPTLRSTLSDTENVGRNDDTVDESPAMVDLCQSIRSPGLRNRLNSTIPLPNNQNNQVTHSISTEADIAQWLSNMTDTGKEIWNIQYFPWTL